MTDEEIDYLIWIARNLTDSELEPAPSPVIKARTLADDVRRALLGKYVTGSAAIAWRNWVRHEATRLK